MKGLNYEVVLAFLHAEILGKSLGLAALSRQGALKANATPPRIFISKVRVWERLEFGKRWIFNLSISL